MKQLKFDHSWVNLITSGEKTTTFRVADDKDISIGDTIQVIDKVKSDEPASWQVIGEADVTEVVIKPINEISKEDLNNQEDRENPEDSLMMLRRYYGGQISKQTPVKIITFKFRPYAEPQSFFGIASQKIAGVDLPRQVKLYADGGSRGNPGPSALGYVICDDNNNVLREGSKYLGVTTNNQAEYHALKEGLEACRAENVQEVDVYMDSLLVVNQMKRIFKVKNRDLWPLYEAIQQICNSFRKVSFQHVPRELNKLADAEVNKALDAIKG